MCYHLDSNNSAFKTMLKENMPNDFLSDTLTDILFKHQILMPKLHPVNKAASSIIINNLEIIMPQLLFYLTKTVSDKLFVIQLCRHLK